MSRKTLGKVVLNFRDQNAKQEYARRRKVIEQIMKQKGCSSKRAVELFKKECLTRMEYLPAELLIDPDDIRKELWVHVKSESA